MRCSIVGAALAVTLAGLGVGACGTGGADSAASAAGTGSVQTGPGVDVAHRTITVGDISALTGPAALNGTHATAGFRTFFEASNARGGIDGWKVKVVVKDSAYEPQEHVQLYNGLQGSIALLHSFGAPPTKAIQPLIDQQQLVTFPVSMSSLWSADAVTAPVGTPYTIDTANALDYVTHGGSRKLKVGIVYQNDEYGADSLRGFKAAQAALGFVDAGEQSFNPGDTSFTAQVQKLKAAGAQVVVVTALPSATGPIVGTGATLGFTPQWILQGPAFAEQLITDDGRADSPQTPVAAALKGALVMSIAAPWGDPRTPGMRQLVADHRRFDASVLPSIYFTYGYAQAEVAAAILRKAIADGDLSRSGILDAKQHLGTVDLGGIVPSVEYGPQPGPPTRQTFIARIDPSAPGFLKSVVAGYDSELGDELKMG